MSQQPTPTQRVTVRPSKVSQATLFPNRHLKKSILILLQGETRGKDRSARHSYHLGSTSDSFAVSPYYAGRFSRGFIPISFPTEEYYEGTQFCASGFSSIYLLSSGKHVSRHLIRFIVFQYKVSFLFLFFSHREGSISGLALKALLLRRLPMHEANLPWKSTDPQVREI